LEDSGRSNGIATVSGVIGFAGFVLSWIPLLGIWIGWVMGVTAIVFGGVGLAMAGHLPRRTGYAMAMVGVILGIVTVVLKSIPILNLL